MLVSVSLLGATSLFADNSAKKDITDVINKKVVSAVNSNKDAIKGNIRVDFQISEKLYNADQADESLIEVGPFKADLACKAYALDNNWLILAGTCMHYSPDPVDRYGVRYTERLERKVISPFKTEKFAIPANNYATNNNIMLLWADNEKMSAALKAVPKVKVLAVSSPDTLFTFSAKNPFKINTARFGSNAIKTRRLKSQSANGKMFQLEEGLTDLSGTATDPIFLMMPNNREFLAGYNNGIMNYVLQLTFDDIFRTFDGKRSPNYFSLTLEDLNFIKRTVQEQRPEDWNHIKNRLFYDQTETPYFND